MHLESRGTIFNVILEDIETKGYRNSEITQNDAIHVLVQYIRLPHQAQTGIPDSRQASFEPCVSFAWESAFRCQWRLQSWPE